MAASDSGTTRAENYTDMITQEHMRCALRPKGIAVVGATERPSSVGRTVVENLLHGYEEKGANPFEIFPVNPTRQTVLGLKCYPAVSAIDSPNCEQVVIITPAGKCVDVVKDCTRNKAVKLIIVISAGFKEVGPEGLAIELELVKVAAEAGIAVVGPNCLGIQCPAWQVNTTFAANSCIRGPIGFISQSGAMCTAVLDWSLKIGFGFSAFISIGSMAHVDWSHCIDYLGEDEETKAILIYMESIGNATNFLRAARKVAAKKPIVVIKAGKTEAAAAAAISHTGSLAGSHEAFLAAMRRAGCLVVDSIAQLQDVGLVTSLQPRPTGNGLLIVTNAGGPGVLATDAATLAGLNMIEAPKEMVAHMDTFLPPAWSRHNPIDVLGDAKAEAYAKCVESVFDHGPAGCSLLVVLAPQAVTESEAAAEAISEVVRRKRKEKHAFDGQVIAAWMGGDKTEEGRRILMSNGIPAFVFPDTAAEAVGLVWKQVECARSLTSPSEATNKDGKERALKIMAPAMKEGRTILTESESKSILKAYGIDVAESIICTNVDAAVTAAHEVRFPCVIKLHSETITHKSDVGGVKLNIKTDEAVRQAWNDIKTNVDKLGPNHFQGVSVQPMLDISSGVELLVGSASDPQFGPMVLFGTGGCFVEVFKDVATSVPPLDLEEATKLIEATKISAALVPGHGERFKGCPIEDVKRTLSAFSLAVCDLYMEIAECEINPLLALPDRVVALDARIVLRKTDDAPETAPATPCML